MLRFAFYLLGSVDISSQSNNREVCTDTWSFVGVGFPNSLVTHQRRLRTAVDRFSKIDVSVPRYEFRPTINSTRMVWGFQPALVNGEGTSPLRLRTVLHKCQHALAPLGLDMSIQVIPCSGFVNPLRPVIDSLPGLQRFL